MKTGWPKYVWPKKMLWTVHSSLFFSNLQTQISGVKCFPSIPSKNLHYRDIIICKAQGCPQNNTKRCIFCLIVFYKSSKAFDFSAISTTTKAIEQEIAFLGCFKKRCHLRKAQFFLIPQMEFRSKFKNKAWIFEQKSVITKYICCVVSTINVPN